MGNLGLKGKKILVTGGSGYLGGHLILKLLKEGARIGSIDVRDTNSNPEVKTYQLDLNDTRSLNETVQEFNPDIVYHLAASLNRNRDFSISEEVLNINLIGTVNLLNALREVDYENFVFASTSEVYGGIKSSKPIKEDDNFIPASPYSLSKYCAEMAIKTHGNIYSKNYTIMRLFNFYGEDMSNSFFLPELVSKLKKNVDFDMTLGEQVRDYIHLNDVIEALTLAADEKANQQTFNVCSGDGKSLRELAMMFKRIIKSNSEINFGALPYRKNEVWNMVGDNSKIKKVLGWQPKIKIESDFEK